MYSRCNPQLNLLGGRQQATFPSRFLRTKCVFILLQAACFGCLPLGASAARGFNAYHDYSYDSYGDYHVQSPSPDVPACTSMQPVMHNPVSTTKAHGLAVQLRESLAALREQSLAQMHTQGTERPEGNGTQSRQRLAERIARAEAEKKPTTPGLVPASASGLPLDFDGPSCISRIADVNTITVSPGQSIQTAINRATPGTVIMVKAGTYNENLMLRGPMGTPDKPVLLVSADGIGAARIVGGPRGAAIGGRKLSNVGIYGFHIVSRAPTGDVGGITFFGKFSRSGSGATESRNIVIAGNTVTGIGEDGIKLTATDNIKVVGNTINGDWRESAIDNVSIENALFAYNAFQGPQQRGNILQAKAGSRNVEVTGNLFDQRTNGITIGGGGTSRFHRDFPDYWKGFEALNMHVHGNVFTNKIKVSAEFVGAHDSSLENNYIAGTVGSRAQSKSGHFTYHSYNNRIINNTVQSAGFFQSNAGETGGYIVEGNKVGGNPGLAVGPAVLPGGLSSILNICPSDASRRSEIR